MTFLSALKKLKKSRDPYRPLIEVLIYRDNILHNLRAYQKLCPNVKFAPVLKSNAYGHGLVEVAKILDDYNRKTLTPTLSQRERGQMSLPFFMVDSLFEARTLRHEGIKTPLLILGYTTAENINHHKLKNTAFAIISLEQLKLIDKNLKRAANFHLKIDTGMRRQGLSPDELPEAIKIIKSNPLIKIEGVCSHLADADNANTDFTKKQIALWNKLAGEAENNSDP